MNIKAYEELFSSLENSSIYCYGIIDEATGHFLQTLSVSQKRPVFVVVENDKKARDLVEQIEQLGLKTSIFPDIVENYHLVEDFDFSTRKDRMKTIINLLEGNIEILVAPVNSLFRKLASKEELEKNKISININSEVDHSKFIENLIKLGYTRRNIIESRGEFAVRGDIIDIFQIHEDHPTRIELFDIEVDSIRKFDINTQLSLEQIEEINIYQNSEIIVDFEDTSILTKIEQELKSVNYLDAQKKQRLSEKFNRLIDEIKYGKKIDNIDLVIPYLNNDSTILDYLTKETIIVFNDFSNIQNRVGALEAFRSEDIGEKIENGELLNSHNKIYHQSLRVFSEIEKFTTINISGLLKNTNLKYDKIIEFSIRQNRKYNGKFEDLIFDLKYFIQNNYFTNIFVPNKKDADELIQKLSDVGIIAKYEGEGSIRIRIGTILDGFEYYKDKVNFISYSQIFKKIKKKRSKTTKNRDIINYSDLIPGDLLVHDTYGIGKYIGIKNIELNKVKMDFIELIFRDGDKLFVPTSDMEKVSKFVGNGDKQPQLSKLNGIEWRKSKQKAKRAIEEIADDLVKLYAKRNDSVGHAFEKDTPWQLEFEDNFKYQETSAQLKAVEEIKADMESSKIMDRLLCGDVGYGKTEVALRAAFKAVMDGKQVVMLAPTTILVKQHFKTMKERFGDFPITIDYLSRFKTTKQKEETIKGLRNGKIDFVVGTHSLVSKEIQFKNLGLLIIDEEQRFGVRHKEKIKEFKEEIDVLTLSATPIPRTLQMSLSGIRDMSLLDEHPENRLPINTYVMEYDPIYIREAILREMSRGGQIYFVYNRVNSIHRMYQRLVELVPEAKIAISHGQMSTRELENVLEDFTDNKYDILLTTTIIETGMDIQNVNTIIVYNADMMGLSQLYQLKGRIGRSDRNSFAYFTYKSNKVLTEIAEKRLKAIKDFNELGSGYKVAMRDLELRGAGNLLGESQSGHIESIGYDLYVRMLKETIDEIKGLKPKKIDKNVKIDLSLDVYIPDEYILDENEKINIYKKISYVETEEDHYSIIDELTDRFGDIPISVQNIIDIAYIKSMMLYNDISEILEKDNNIIVNFENDDFFTKEKIKLLSENYRDEINFSFVGKPFIYIKNKKGYLLKILEMFKIISKINKGEIYEEN